MRPLLRRGSFVRLWTRFDGSVSQSHNTRNGLWRHDYPACRRALQIWASPSPCACARAVEPRFSSCRKNRGDIIRFCLCLIVRSLQRETHKPQERSPILTCSQVVARLLSPSAGCISSRSWTRSSTSRKCQARRSGRGESLTDSVSVWESRRQAPRFSERSAFPREFIGFTHMRRRTIG